MTQDPKEVFIIAGPNGAGKTTFALNLIDNSFIEHFVNADEIAKEYKDLSESVANIKASREFLKMIASLEKGSEPFAFETTLSGRGHLKRVKYLQEQGWIVSLYYLFVTSPDISVSRVAERVVHGGHNIPSEDIHRRFPKSLVGFYNDFLPLVDYAECILNDEQEPKSVFKCFNGEIVKIDEMLFEKFLELEALCRK